MLIVFVVMSQRNQPCNVCDGTEYSLESGSYFCVKCGVQSPDIRELVNDEYWGGQKTGKVSVPAPSQEVGTQEKTLTSWEVLNIVLRGLVKELTLLGAPQELKLVVLQLWASFLKKTEVASICKNSEKRPQLGGNLRKRDAESMCGTNKKLINNDRRPISQNMGKKSCKSNVKESTSFTNTRIEKYGLTQKIKKLQKAEYEQSSVSIQPAEITLESLSGKSFFSPSQKSHKSKKILVQEAKSAQHASMSKVFAILRLALLILDSDIHLGDILRWSGEGYISLLNAEKLLPAGTSVGKEVFPIFVSNLNSRPSINKNVLIMAKLLGVEDISVRILPLIERYLKELQLPDDLLIIIKLMMELNPSRLRLTDSVNYEGRAMAYILFALKFLFGLDGITEKRISKVAKVINRKQENSERKLFNWSEWVNYINCRSSVVSVYHQATRDLYHPASAVGGSKPFLSHWEKLPAKQILQRRHVISPNVKVGMSRFLKDFRHSPAEPLPPALTPLSSTLMEIFVRDLHIPPRAKRILEQEFTNDTIKYLYNKITQEEIHKDYNISFEAVLSAKVVKVTKPVVFEGSSTKPSLKGNKKMIDVKIYAEEGNSNKRNRHNPELDMRGSLLPNPKDILQGVKLKDRSEFSEEINVLPVCGRKYWVYHSGFSHNKNQIGLFNYVAEYVFPNDFHWLLKVASFVTHVCPRDLYTQLSYVEKMYLEYVTKKRKPRKFFEGHW